MNESCHMNGSCARDICEWHDHHKCLFIYHVSLMSLPLWGGSLKFQVSFTEYRLFYRALLQKRPINLRSLLIVATSYSNIAAHITYVSLSYYRVVKTHRIPYLYRSFSAKEPYI